MVNLSEYFLFKSALEPNEYSAGSGSGTAVSMLGFDRACYAVNIGKQSSGSVAVSVYESSAAAGTYSEISGAQQAVAAAGSAIASGMHLIEVPVSGSKPWQKVSYAVGTDAVDLSIVGIGYNGSRKLPPSQDNTPARV